MSAERNHLGQLVIPEKKREWNYKKPKERSKTPRKTRFQAFKFTEVLIDAKTIAARIRDPEWRVFKFYDHMKPATYITGHIFESLHNLDPDCLYNATISRKIKTLNLLSLAPHDEQ